MISESFILYLVFLSIERVSINVCIEKGTET